MKERILSLFLILALLLGLTACSDSKKESTDVSLPAASSTSEILFPQSGDLNATALSTENFSISKGEMVYFFALSVSDFLSYYYDYISYIGLDPAKSFKEQKSMYGENNESWFDFFLADARSYAEDYLLFCEKGKAMGLELDEEDQKYIDTQKKILEDEAAPYGWNIDTYLQQLYSTTIEWKYMESGLRITRLAQKTYQKLIGDHTFTDAEIEAEYLADKKNYSLVDYYAVDFGDGENIPDEVLEKVRKALASVSSLDDFTAVVKDFLLATRTTKTLEDAGGLDAYTKKYMSESERLRQKYADNEISRWAFDDVTEEGSIFTKDNESTQAPFAYYLLKKPYKDETVTVDIRHILFLLNSQGGSFADKELARAEAERVYRQWLSEGAGVDRFISLCAEYSSDGNAASGGLYTSVPQGQMVAPFNDWCFDESRKPGDHGIVDTEFGSHIMYFEKRNIAWEQSVRTALSHRLYDTIRDEQNTETPVTVNDEVLQSINW